MSFEAIIVFVTDIFSGSCFFSLPFSSLCVPLFSSVESEFYLKFQMADCPQMSVHSFIFFPPFFFFEVAVLTSMPYFAFLCSFKN